MPLTAGTRLGPYEIVAFIGAGGVGEFFHARDTYLNRDITIKVLPESFAADPGPSAGSPQAQLYVVTELLEGETLREVLQTGAL